MIRTQPPLTSPHRRWLTTAALALVVLALIGARPWSGSAERTTLALLSPTGGGLGPGSAGAEAHRHPIAEVPTGRAAASTRIRFEPELLVLPGRGRAAVVPAATVDGELKVPENVEHLGWWDGSSYPGDPFGSTVIAGHVDSATQGLGFFARLLGVRVGDAVVLRGAGHVARYEVSSVRTVRKSALAAGSSAFRQDGPHRLVLITCTGSYHPDQGGYDSNLVVVAKPVGRVR